MIQFGDHVYNLLFTRDPQACSLDRLAAATSLNIKEMISALQKATPKSKNCITFHSNFSRSHFFCSKFYDRARKVVKCVNWKFV